MNHDALRGDGALLDAYRDRKLLDQVAATNQEI